MKTLPTPLLAYHGQPAIKKKYLARVRAHQKADEIVAGQYWENGKGCAVIVGAEFGDHRTSEEASRPRMTFWQG